MGVRVAERACLPRGAMSSSRVGPVPQEGRWRYVVRSGSGCGVKLRVPGGRVLVCGFSTAVLAARAADEFCSVLHGGQRPNWAACHAHAELDPATDVPLALFPEAFASKLEEVRALVAQNASRV